MSAAYRGQTLLAKTAGVNIVAGVVLLICRLTPGLPDAAASVIVGFLVLGGTGTVVAAIRHESEGPPIDQAIDHLIDALVASRPPDYAREPLRLVDQKENGSTIPAQRRTVL